jgi:type III secretion protein Q
MRTGATRTPEGDLLLEPFEAIAAWGTGGQQRAVAAVQVDARLVTFLEPFKMTDHTAFAQLDPFDEHSSGAEPAHEELGSLEVPVTFEVDSLPLSLDALSALGPGYVIELPRRADQLALKLVAYGRTIGTGELVTVGERLGVRVLSIAHHRAARGRAAHPSIGQAGSDDPVQ